MVILFILHTLRTHIGIQSIVCVHIDYANREESKHEADFVESYSKQLGCIFHKRTINEVTRGVTDRSAYEKISRDIRYNFYKEILGSHSSHSSADSSSGAGIIFGHHKGDVQENVLSNIMR
jgi:tRNA(Ile)-lysidine synthase TilS/MesJ